MKKYLVLGVVLLCFLLACGCQGTSADSESKDGVSSEPSVSDVSAPDTDASEDEDTASYITVPAGFDYSIWQVMVNGKVYYGTDEDGPMGDSGVVEGNIRGTVNEGETPTTNGYSNFGVGGGYTYDDGDGRIQVFTPDGCWRYFECRE